MIEVDGLSKQYGGTRAVDDLTFTVPAGTVTGFLGPNGAGKSTTMRLIAGLGTPTAGRVRVNGRDFRRSPAPMAELGVLLEAGSAHPGRRARDHLLCLARTNGIGRRRVDEVLDLVGLGAVAGRRVRGFSLGMGQRLGVAVALLGDPRVLVLDEPVNGLDPEGVLWIRGLLRDLASEGRTVLVSSHLMGEMALTASRVVVLARGRLVADTTVADLVGPGTAVTVRTPEPGRLRAALAGPGVSVHDDSGGLRVRGLTAEQVGAAAWRAEVPVLELTAHRPSLEEAFLELTADLAEHRAGRPR